MKNQNDNTPRNTKQLIADTSMRLFYELGYEKATIRKIAEACGITHAAIFKYYKSKEELACLFISRYLSWLIKHSLTFSQTYSEDEHSDQYSILYYWVRHYTIIADDKNFATFIVEFSAKAFDSLLEITIKYVKQLPRIFVRKNYKKGKNDLFIDINILAHCEYALSKMIYHNQIDVNKAVLYAINEMNLIDELGVDIKLEDIDNFCAKFFPKDQSKNLNVLELIL